MSFAFIAMGIFLGVYAFSTNATSRGIGGITWDNGNYLTSTFRDADPSTWDIITALYGSGDEWSVYTTNWSGYTSGSCLSGGMNVVYTGSLSLTWLSENTIYVLTGTASIWNEMIVMANCSAIISMNTTGTIFYNNTQLLNDAIFYADGKQHIIFDNISTDGTWDWIGWSHAVNRYGIYLSGVINANIHQTSFYNNSYGLRLNFSSYTTVNHSQTHNNSYWLYVTSSFYNDLDNVQVYNNTNGIYLFSASNNTINNVQTYNNYYGLHVYDSTYNAINNTQAYNNVHGIYLNSWTNNAINNIQSYNNANGISLNSWANNTINNVQSYNNGNGIYLNSVTTWNMYYGTLLFFANTTNISWTTTNLTTWSNIDYPWIFATGAIITTWDMSRDYVTNVINTNDEYLLSWTGSITTFTWIQSAYKILETENYSYGSGIATQTQPVIYSGTSLTTWGDFDTTKYIWSDVTKLTGNLLSLPTYTNTTWLTVTGISSDSSIDNYSIFGNTVSYIFWTTINVATWIQLTTGDGTKYIVTQLYGDNYFATHFQKSIILDMTTPIFTWTTLSWTSILSGGYYNTGIIITFDDTNISGATLNSVAYTSGTTITTWGAYTFVVRDLAGNNTGITFTIDITNPTLNIYNDNDDDLTPYFSDGDFFDTNIIVVWADNTVFEKFELNWSFYTWSSLTIAWEETWVLTWYDKAGNTTGITFTIDKTSPIFTWTTLWSSVSGNVVSGWYYNTGVVIAFADDNLLFASIYEISWGVWTEVDADFTSLDTILTWWTYIFRVWDNNQTVTWMIFTIDTTNPSVTSIYPTSGLDYTGGVYNSNNITFTRTGSDTNMSGYILYVDWDAYPTTSTWYTVLLANWSYTWYVTAIDLAGNTWSSATMPFTLSTTFAATWTITGTNIVYNGIYPYTNNYVSIYLVPNQPCTYIVTWDIYEQITGSITSTAIAYPVLTWINTAKIISVIFTNASGDVVTWTVTAYLDNTVATGTLTSPASWATLTGGFNLVWAEAWADNVGLSWYQYVVTSSTWVVLKSGYTTTAVRTATITTGEFGNTWTFSWYVKTFDKLNNSWVSAVRPFYYSGVADTTPDTFSFSNVTSARLDRVYGSNTLTITWFTANTSVLASVDKWVLYISGNMVGTTGFVQNGWTVKVELISSDEYETQVNSTLTIWWVSATFRVTTMSEEDDTTIDYEDIDTDLSNTEKLQIVAIFETLRDLYYGDKEEEFFTSLMVMLQSKIDDLWTSSADINQRDALQYLYDLAEQYYDDGLDSWSGISWTSRIVNGVYTAPNGKKYTITYDSAKWQFTSTNFITPKYYPTLDVLKYDIDRNNPAWSAYANAKVIQARWGKISIDGTRQTSPYTAPNRKVFYFFKTVSGRFSSYTFTTEKYFDSLNDVKKHIYDNNR